MTSMEQLQSVALKHSELKTKMEELVAPTDLLHIESEKIGEFLATLSEKCFNQLTYDVYTNVPTGVMTRDEISGHALRSGIVSACGALVQWDIYSSLELCADILEDVNAHSEAKMLRDLVIKYEAMDNMEGRA